MRTGLAGLAGDCEIDTVDAPRESPDPRPLGTASLSDLTLDELLPGSLINALLLILGASSSVSQLH
jgi:hypothetical protein